MEVEENEMEENKVESVERQNGSELLDGRIRLDEKAEGGLQDDSSVLSISSQLTNGDSGERQVEGGEASTRAFWSDCERRNTCVLLLSRA